jgi:hypothetical protein
VVRRPPASTALASIINTRPLIIFSFGMGDTFRRKFSSDAGASEATERRRRDGLKMGIAVCRLH